ncbi:AraC family transcriptional regulator ligand-binding domain-containing protein [Atopomonas sediminilitoris]|uniref:AraC family transcriptional regulator ligand-binding domain-containing protein n=1 Tax=Atopomonas sediminilitoris TaxID=2919919 RepID=UPI001F4ECEF5|nr:AraC family transcriptional regulator ligand-binding domain-containing protein [Atopomonas sediminilitoris]MCJ8168447.1 AraC family transcriptional regulator ligand-binding domain-containing protein [Atopomonas sediminilitoris]
MTQIARSAVLVGFEDLCRQCGVNPHQLLLRCGLDPLLLRREDLYLPYARFAELLNLASAQSGCVTFGLRLSEYHDYLVLGPFGLLLSQAASMADVLRLAQQYVHLHAQGISLSAHPCSQGLQVDYQLNLATAQPLRQLLELGIGVVQRSMSSLFQQQWQPQRVLFEHACVGERDEYARLFNCPVLFEQSCSGFVMPAQALALKPIEQRQVLSDYLLARFGAQRPALSLAQQIALILQSILPTGEATLTVVARLLDRHPRCVQQALQAQGLSFRQLLAQVRFAEAQQQLQLSAQSITDLALNLGYADETAFSRAFRRWSGQSPQQWRDRARVASTS